jgi:hypothetical protein
MRKLVRLLLKHYDRFGIFALVGWLGWIVGVVFVPALVMQELLIILFNLSVKLAGFLSMLAIAPLAFYLFLPIQAAGFLLLERMWMFIGLYDLFYWEPFRIRKLVGRLANEQNSLDKES